MSMKNLNLILISAAMLAVNAYALNLPKPPIMSDLSSKEACAAYSNEMAKYLEEQMVQTNNTNDMANMFWFSSFARTDLMNSGENWEENGKHYVRMYRSSPGCAMVGILHEQPHLSMIFEKLVSAYNTAAQHNTVIPTATFYLQGEKDICTPQNGYKNCELKIESK